MKKHSLNVTLEFYLGSGNSFHELFNFLEIKRQYSLQNGRTPPHFHLIEWDEVVNCDIRRLVAKCGFNQPSGRLRYLQGNIFFAIGGFPSEKGELCENPLVRRFFRCATEQWGGWLFFASLESDTLKVVISCLLEKLIVIRMEASDQFLVLTNRKILEKCFLRMLGPAAQFMEQAGFSTEEGLEHLQKVAQHVGVAGEI